MDRAELGQWVANEFRDLVRRVAARPRTSETLDLARAGARVIIGEAISKGAPRSIENVQVRADLNGDGEVTIHVRAEGTAKAGWDKLFPEEKHEAA